MSKVSSPKKFQRINELLAKIEQAKEDSERAHPFCKKVLLQQEWDDLVIEAADQALTVRQAGKVYDLSREYSDARGIAADRLKNLCRSNKRQFENSPWVFLVDL